MKTDEADKPSSSPPPSRAAEDQKDGDASPPPPAGDAESEMRGVHAKEEIRVHEVVVSVPRQCLITVEMGKATPIGRLIAQANLDLDAPKHV
jgi:histone-lysine N-methyltransferase SETD3